jgi:octaprenyl-diphosphate synthase
LSEADYYSIINAKTAELTAVCCELGARYAGASEVLVRNLEGYGRELGIAFQIADDLLDFTGEENETGKTLGTDLAQQKPTLPLIHALNASSAAERQALIDLLESQPTVGMLLPHLEANGSLDYARQQAIAFANRAIARLQELPPSAARDVLMSLPEFAVRRSH